MADASGQGFTASIVNSIPNYLSADRSTLGQIGGVTGAIQYVKLVWGNSGNAYFVDDQGDNPTPLPISLNNAENYWLIDAVLNTVKTLGGASAVNVNVVNSTGLCFAGLNVSLGSELFIAGVCAPIQGIGSNLGVTFGGITVGPLRVRNFISGAGVTESIQVTFGAIGGTVNVANLNIGNVNFGASGIAISGWCGAAGTSLPAYIVGGTLDAINNTVNVNIKSRDFGFTFATVLQDRGGGNIGHSGGTFIGFPVVGVTGGNPVAVTGAVSITGTASVTGSVHILGTPTVSISGTPTVSISGTPTVAVSGNPAVTGSVYIQGTPTVSLSSGTSVNVQTASGTTLGSVLLDASGGVVGYSGSTFLGYPVQIVGGLSLSGLTIAGLTITIPSTVSISGGTVAISGGTLSSLTILGGTFAALNITNISGGTINVGNKVQVFNKAGVDTLDTYITNTSVPVQATSWNASSPNESLKTHLEGGAAGLGLKVTGLSIGSGFTLTNIDSSLLGTTGTSGSNSGLGVTFKAISGTVDLVSTAVVSVKGDSSSLTTSPVGITLLGNLKQLVAPPISASGPTFAGTVLGIGVYGRTSTGGYTPVGMTGDALKVSIEGVGLCLGSVTVSGVCFGDGITLSGGTANFLNVVGGTIAVLNISNISGGTINVGNTVGVTGSVGIFNTGMTISNGTAQRPIKVHLTKDDGTFFANYDKGFPVLGLTSNPLYVQGVCGAYQQVVVNGVTIWDVGVSFGSVRGSVSISPLTGNTGIAGLSGGGTTFNVVLTDVLGRPIGYGLTGPTATFLGFPVFGVSGATALGVTFSSVKLGGSAGTIFENLASRFTGTGGTQAYWLGVTFDGSFSSSVTISDVYIKATGAGGIGGQSGGGSTFNVVLTDILGKPIGYGVSGAGATFIGFPVFGVSGATALGVTGTVSIVPSRGSTGVGGQSGGGTTFNVVLTDILGRPIGYGISGAEATFLGFPVFGIGTGATSININIKGFEAFEGGITYRGNCLGSEIPATSLYAGGTYFRISPVEGLLEEPGVTLTGKVFVVGDSMSSVGVTLTFPSTYSITGTGIGVSLGTAAVNIVSSSASNTFGSVLVTPGGTPIGMSGSSFIGFPVMGVSGATPIAVTFGVITFGAAGMGVTFGGITFTTTRTVIVGSSFADGGGNLGIPVFGVQGATSVRVLIEGGTVAGIFVAESPGITVMGVTTGIPVIGVSGGMPIAVTFAASPTSLNLPTTGITIASIASGVIVGVSGGTIGIATIGGGNVTVSGSVSLASGVQDIGTVSVKNDTNNSTTLLGASAGAGLLVTQKAGPAFARGLTLDNLFIGITNTGVIVSPDGSIVGLSGATVYYLKTKPVCMTTNYVGDGRATGTLPGGEISVPLKQGLWIQLTKWDLISHVLVGYTASSQAEFERNAQVLTKEYEMAPIWAHALDQFRRFPGYTGNNNAIGPSGLTGYDTNGSKTHGDWNTGNVFPAAQRQFVGLVEKPSRLFIPCRDAGLVYVQVKGDYAGHAIGAGFWDHETGQWSATTLYERSYYSRSFSGFQGDGSPDLTVDGQPGDFDNTYTPIDGAWGMVSYSGTTASAGSAIAQILSSYTNNPFIRIWGY